MGVVTVAAMTATTVAAMMATTALARAAAWTTVSKRRATMVRHNHARISATRRAAGLVATSRPTSVGARPDTFSATAVMALRIPLLVVHARTSSALQLWGLPKSIKGRVSFSWGLLS